jgi:hypothetical protein
MASQKCGGGGTWRAIIWCYRKPENRQGLLHLFSKNKKITHSGSHDNYLNSFQGQHAWQPKDLPLGLAHQGFRPLSIVPYWGPSFQHKNLWGKNYIKTITDGTQRTWLGLFSFKKGICTPYWKRQRLKSLLLNLVKCTLLSFLYLKIILNPFLTREFLVFGFSK